MSHLFERPIFIFPIYCIEHAIVTFLISVFFYFTKIFLTDCYLCV